MFQFLSSALAGMVYHLSHALGDKNISAFEFVSHYVRTGMSQQGSLYIFYRTDANDDSVIDSDEVDATFTLFDANSKLTLSYM